MLYRARTTRIAILDLTLFAGLPAGMAGATWRITCLNRYGRKHGANRLFSWAGGSRGCLSTNFSKIDAFMLDLIRILSTASRYLHCAKCTALSALRSENQRIFSLPGTDFAPVIKFTVPWRMMSWRKCNVALTIIFAGAFISSRGYVLAGDHWVGGQRFLLFTGDFHLWRFKIWTAVCSHFFRLSLSSMQITRRFGQFSFLLNYMKISVDYITIY